MSCAWFDHLFLLDFDSSPAAARKFYDEGVKTLDGLFSCVFFRSSTFYLYVMSDGLFLIR